jgi:hypothetical protein
MDIAELCIEAVFKCGRFVKVPMTPLSTQRTCLLNTTVCTPVNNAITVRCTGTTDSVATTCSAGFYLAANDTCQGD